MQTFPGYVFGDDANMEELQLSLTVCEIERAKLDGRCSVVGDDNMLVSAAGDDSVHVPPRTSPVQ